MGEDVVGVGYCVGNWRVRHDNNTVSSVRRPETLSTITQNLYVYVLYVLRNSSNDKGQDSTKNLDCGTFAIFTDLGFSCAMTSSATKSHQGPMLSKGRGSPIFQHKFKLNKRSVRCPQCTVLLTAIGQRTTLPDYFSTWPSTLLHAIPNLHRHPIPPFDVEPWAWARAFCQSVWYWYLASACLSLWN